MDAVLDPEAAEMQTAEHGAYELNMKDFDFTLSEDGEVLEGYDESEEQYE